MYQAKYTRVIIFFVKPVVFKKYILYFLFPIIKYIPRDGDQVTKMKVKCVAEEYRTDSAS